jgi:hypothetical protein
MHNTIHTLYLPEVKRANNKVLLEELLRDYPDYGIIVATSERRVGMSYYRASFHAFFCVYMMCGVVDSAIQRDIIVYGGYGQE